MHGTEEQPVDEPEEQSVEDASDGRCNSLQDKDETHRAAASEDRQCTNKRVRKGSFSVSHGHVYESTLTSS